MKLISGNHSDGLEQRCFIGAQAFRVMTSFSVMSSVTSDFLTWFDLLDDRFVVAVLHLSDVQQGVRVPVVGGPVVHEHPRTAAAAVHHDPVIQSGVEDVGGLHGLCDGEVPVGGQTQERHENAAFTSSWVTSHTLINHVVCEKLQMIKCENVSQ